MAKGAKAGLTLTTNTSQFKRGMRDARGEMKATTGKGEGGLGALAIGAVTAGVAIGALTTAFGAWKDDMIKTRDAAMQMEAGMKLLYFRAKYMQPAMDDIRHTLQAMAIEAGKKDWLELAVALDIALAGTENEADALKILNASLMVNIMRGTDLNTVTQALTKAYISYGDEIKSNDELLGGLIGTANEAAADFTKVAYQFPAWGTAAKQAGLGFYDACALFVLGTKEAKNAEAATVGMTEGLRALLGTTEGSRKALEELGIYGIPPLEQLARIKDKLAQIDAKYKDPAMAIAQKQAFLTEIAPSKEAMTWLINVSNILDQQLRTRKAIIEAGKGMEGMEQRYKARPISARERVATMEAIGVAERGLRPVDWSERYIEWPWRQAKAEHPWYDRIPAATGYAMEELLRGQGVAPSPQGLQPWSGKVIEVRITADQMQDLKGIVGGKPTGD